MSNGLAVRDLVSTIAAACSSAWGVSQTYVGQARVAPTQLPYAVVSVGQVSIAFQTVTNVEQSYSFQIVGRFAWPADSTRPIELEKSDRADSLIAALQTGATFGLYGYRPLVTAVDFTESDDPSDGAYMVTLTFEVCASAPHH